MSKTIEMPQNWDNHVDWESYYSSLPQDEKSYDSVIRTLGDGFDLNHLCQLMDSLLDQKRLSIWFPGCGLSPLPKIFAAYGFSVYATDIALTAINYQNRRNLRIDSLISQIILKNLPSGNGELNALVHDFRTEFKSEFFDVIFNVNSISALPAYSMKSTAQTHFIALKPGGNAVFELINMQGILWGQLEKILDEVGFHVPFYELNQWYRNELNKTGIPYTLVVGQPVIPNYELESKEYNQSIDILREITKQYRDQLEVEYRRDQKKVDGFTKIASLMNTRH